ncbi:M14 family zinc carboxypeptidase [Georgenia phoenicis]|uniref:M14 family zinc carboxypeptidase n=1 Tax=unclassified Georgenia TaxID=2626815 RepID=UPI0039AF6E5B
MAVVGAAGVALLASLVATPPTLAQVAEPGVTGLEVEQQMGFATLTWEPVAGVEEYQIERTPVDENDEPVGEPVITGIWRPNRQVDQSEPAFADANFDPGDRFRWRVGIEGEAFSEPVYDTTLPQWGDPDVPGESLRTGWEQTFGERYTTDVEEAEYTAELDALSDRVRVVEIGRTLQDRPINMFIIGYPNPPATPEEIAEGDTALVNCNVHGNEPSSREACFILARQLAFGEDERTLDILSESTIMLVPSINADGRALNQRGNATGQDLNRDFSLIRQPETFGFTEMLRDYRPDAAFDGHEYGNTRAGDLPVMFPRHLNVPEVVHLQSKDLVENWLYERGSEDGWWFCPYGCEGGNTVGMSQETILRNTLGLKNIVGVLLEARSSGGETRPADGGSQTPESRKRKTYSAMYTFEQYFDYFHENKEDIVAAGEAGRAQQVLNRGDIVFRGSYTVDPFPAPHPGEAPPDPEIPGPEQILEAPVCGYLLTEEQYHGVREDSPEGFPTTLADRIEAHGWRVQERARGYMVPLTQEQRGLIPLLLDGQAAEPWTSAQRLYGPANHRVTLPDSACGKVSEPPSRRTPTTAELSYTSD